MARDKNGGKTPETPELIDVRQAPERRGWHIGKLIWGILLVGTGVLLLLYNFGTVSVDFDRLLSLWPVLIIAVGLSFLTIRGPAAIVITLLLVAGLAALVGSVLSGRVAPRQDTVQQDITIDRRNDDVSQAEVSIESGAGELRLRSSDSEPLVRAELDSDISRLERQDSIQGGTQRVRLELEPRGRWWMQGSRNDMDVTLTESLPIDLMLDSGASRVDADLSRVQLRRLELQAGASDVELRIGARTSQTDVDIDAGASSVTVLVPQASGVRVELDAGMSDRELPGLRQLDSGVYESDNYAAAEHKINIRGSIGMTGFELRRY